MKWQGACRAEKTRFSSKKREVLREMTELSREIYTVVKSEPALPPVVLKKLSDADCARAISVIVTATFFS
jgi:hypothetical protein